MGRIDGQARQESDGPGAHHCEGGSQPDGGTCQVRTDGQDPGIRRRHGQAVAQAHAHTGAEERERVCRTCGPQGKRHKKPHAGKHPACEDQARRRMARAAAPDKVGSQDEARRDDPHGQPDSDAGGRAELRRHQGAPPMNA